MPPFNPDGINPIKPVGFAYSHNPMGVATLFASLALSIQETEKIPVFWKDGKIMFSDPMPLPFGVEEPQPYWVGYVFSNSRYRDLTNVYGLYQPYWEFHDHRNQIRHKGVYADMLSKNYRKFSDSSIITTEEAIQVVADVFMHWSYTKEIINRIFAQNFDPRTGSNSSMLLK